MILPQEKTYGHIPVLPKETVEFVMPYDNGIKYVVDGTVGYGGHSELILRKNPHAFLLGLDRDENVLPAASERLDFAKDRVILKHSNFSRLRENVFSAGWSAVDAVLLDIGVSSPQIDTPGRGFSFRFGDSPLDMRMNPRSELNAEKVLNTYSEQELTRVFREYGEFPEQHYLQREICRIREQTPFRKVSDFSNLCDKVLRNKKHGKSLPAPTLPFQAVRIEVNNELGELESVLQQAVEILKPGGRLCVICFHSLESKIVKHFFVNNQRTCICPPGCPVCICHWKPKLKILTKKPVTASQAELENNSRAACAVLRCAEKLDDSET